MSLWLWVNVGLGALFVLAIVGVPMWLVLKRPDIPPTYAELPSQPRVREYQTTGHSTPQAAAQAWVPRQATAEQWRPHQPAGWHQSPAAGD